MSASIRYQLHRALGFAKSSSLSEAEQRATCGTLKAITLVLCVSLALLRAVNASELHEFTNGQPADADKVNQNFTLLDGKVQQALAQNDRDLSRYSFHKVDVNCVEDSQALNNIFDSTAHRDPVAFHITGICDFSRYVLARQIALIGNVGSAGNGIHTNLDGEGPFGALTLADSHLWLDDLAVNTAHIISYGSSYVRIDETVFLNDQGGPLEFRLRSGSLMRIFSVAQNADRPDFLARLTGSELMIQGGTFTLNTVTAKLGSRFWCRNCTGVSVGMIDLKLNSSFCAFWNGPNADTTINLSNNSSFLANAGGFDTNLINTVKDESSSIVWDEQASQVCVND